MWDGQRWVSRELPPAVQMTAPGTYLPAGTSAIAPKNPAISLLISFFIPGVGSLLNGATTTGTIILIGYLVSIPLMFLLIGFVTYPAFWIWGMVDAYQSAQAWNARHGILS